jgi:hypothetical protein
MNIYIDTDVNTHLHIYTVYTNIHTYVSHIKYHNQDVMQEQEMLLPEQRLKNIQDLFMQASVFHTSQERSPINMDQK